MDGTDMNRDTRIIYLSPSFPGAKTLCTIRDALTELWERGWAVICPSLVQDWIMRHHPDTQMLYALRAAQATNESLLAGCDALFLMPGWALCDEGHTLYSLAEQYDVEVICASGDGGVPLPAGRCSCHS